MIICMLHCSGVIEMNERVFYSDGEVMFRYNMDVHPDPDSFTMHTHNLCEVYLFLNGKASFRIEGSEYRLERGDLLVMRPAEAHCIQVQPDYPYERISMHFDPELFERIDPEHKLLRVFTDREAGRFNRFSTTDFQDQSYRMMLSQLMQPETCHRLNIIAALIPMLNQLHQLYLQRDEHAPAGEGTLLFQVIRHINEHLAEPLTLDALCEQFYISKPQLCRSFKRTTGASVGEYIAAKRLLQAQSMLRAGSPPTQVCTACGFNDYSAFYRAYRKHFGIGPKKTMQG